TVAVLSSLDGSLPSLFARQVPTRKSIPILALASPSPPSSSSFPPSTFFLPLPTQSHHPTRNSQTRNSPPPTDRSSPRKNPFSLALIVFDLRLLLPCGDDICAHPSPHSNLGHTFHAAGFLHRQTKRVVTGVAAPDFGTIPRVSLPATAYRKGRIHSPSLTNTPTHSTDRFQSPRRQLPSLCTLSYQSSSPQNSINAR
ncbi:hypothetical protein CORC01_11907, partial [Colletotrichum orchidophilum]